MTRSYSPRSRRTTQRIVIARPRDPSITTLGFTCFRVIAIDEPPIRRIDIKNTMSAFIR
jgi:hypothetical protein